MALAQIGEAMGLWSPSALAHLLPSLPPQGSLSGGRQWISVVFTRPSTIPFLLGIRTGFSSQKLSFSPDLRQWGSGGTDSLGPSPLASDQGFWLV